MRLRFHLILTVMLCLTVNIALGGEFEAMVAEGTQLIQQGLDRWSEEDLLQGRFLFQRVLNLNIEPHLIHYYLAYADYRLAIFYMAGENKKNTGYYIDEAIEHLKESIRLKNDWAESRALLSALYGNKIGIKPELSNTLGPKAGIEIEAARRIEPENPRVWLIKGISANFTPKLFGGGKDEAIKDLTKAIELFETCELADSLSPDWGHSEAWAWLGVVQMDLENCDEAETSFEKALEVNPNNGWVTHQLMPELAQKRKDCPGEGEKTPIVILGGRLIDGTGSDPVSDAVIIIEDNKIKAVSRKGDIKYPAEAKVIRTEGKTIIPGLIDVHVHVGGSPGGCVSSAEFTPDQFQKNLLGYLLCGVTTIRSVGDDTGMILKFREQERKGRLTSPRIFAVGPCFTAPGGHPTEIFKAFPPLLEAATRQVSGPDSARQLVRELVPLGVDAIKAVYDSTSLGLPKLSSPCLEAIIDEAHRHSLKVLVHIAELTDARDAVLAGADGLEHMVCKGEILPADDLPEIMAEKGVFWAPTLSVFEAGFRFSTEPEIVADPWLRRSVSKLVLESITAEGSRVKRAAAEPERVERYKKALGLAKRNVKDCADAGVKIALGTDAGNSLVFHGPAVHRELRLLVDAGLTPMQALVAGTNTASQYLGIEDSLGTVETGKLADVVVIEGNPLKDISCTKNITVVIKNGRILDLDSLRLRINPPPRPPISSEELPSVFDDFEDGDPISNWETEWFSISDQVTGGGSSAQLEIVGGGAEGSKGAVRMSGQISPKLGFAAFAGIGAPFRSDFITLVDVSQYTGIQFYVKGDGKQYRMVLMTEAVRDYDDYGRVFSTTKHWTLVKIPFSELAQIGFGQPVPWDGGKVKGITVFAMGFMPGPFRLSIDGIRFYK